jgi:hypothetical protein
MYCFSRIFTVSQFEMKLLGQILDRGRTAAPADVMRKALGVEGIVGQKVQPLALHFAATPALDAPNLELEIDKRIAAGQIANLTRAPVVPAQVRSSTAAAERSFERRSRVMTRAFRSPKTPRTVGRGRKPGKAYVSTVAAFASSRYPCKHIRRFHRP